MLQLARAIVGVVSDIVRLGILFLSSSSTIRAENLVLRKQLAFYIERGIKPKRVDHATRVSRALLFQTLRFARCGSHRTTLDHRSLAPTGMADLLALEVQGGSTADSAGVAVAHSPNVHGEPALG